MFVSQNGQAVKMSGQQIMGMLPDTMVYHNGQWVKLATLLPPPLRGSPTSEGSPWSKVKGASVSFRNPRLSPGMYVLRIHEIKWVKGREGNFLVVEGNVLISSYDAARPETQEAQQEGRRVSILHKHNDSFGSNAKGLLWAVSGFDAAGVPRSLDDPGLEDPAEYDAMISEQQPAQGALIAVRVTQAKSRAGNPYPRYDYWPCKALPDGKPDEQSIPW
jgi:hypothetical protein